MNVFLVSLVAYALAMLGLAAGRLLGRPGVRGPCGARGAGCEGCPRGREGTCEPSSAPPRS